MPVKGKIVPAYSDTPGAVPDGSTLIDRGDGNPPVAPSIGEILTNVADGRSWIKKSDGTFASHGVGGSTSDDIGNDSGVAGSTVTEALDALDSGKSDTGHTHIAGDITSVSGLSVLGRANSSTGNAAAITASGAGQVLLCSGSALYFGLLDYNAITPNGLAFHSLPTAGQYQILCRASAGTGDLETFQSTAFIFTLLDDTSASAARSTLGLVAIASTGSATDLSSGRVALARGGTNADLSATGGAGQVVKQSTLGGAFTVGLVDPTLMSAGGASAGNVLVYNGGAWAPTTLAASDLTNDSGVAGATIGDALDTLDAKVDVGAVTSSGLTMATSRLLGRTTASTGAIQEIQVSSALSLSLGVLGLSDGDKGDVVVSGSGATWTLDSSVVTSAARTVLDDASVSAMVNTLGGGTATGSGVLVRQDSPVLLGTAEFAASGWKMPDDGINFYLTFGVSSLSNNATFKVSLSGTATVLAMGDGTNVFHGTVTIPNTGLRVLDTDASHTLVLVPGSNLTANRTLQFITGDVNRNLTCYSTATSRLFARKTSGAGDWEECTLSEILDFIGSATQGDILYRGASTWSRLPKGTANQMLRMNSGATAPEWVAHPAEFLLPIGDETTAITTGTGKFTFRAPFAFTLTAVKASVTTAPTGANLVIDINKNGTTMLSTRLSIDATEKTSATAATPAVISVSSVAADDEITVDFDTVGAGTAGAGVKVWLVGSR